MTTKDEQIKELNKEIDALQEKATLSLMLKEGQELQEVNNFIIKTNAQLFAIEQMLCGLLAEIKKTDMAEQKKTFEIFRKSYFIEELKRWIKKY